ncbi:hypothetical protein C8R45DRAFT_1062899 [Mycena sanguinolenta]|nr:hypothetical protein C8R45DRAFT_1062899 [Mycena sanguinolenta]
MHYRANKHVDFRYNKDRTKVQCRACSSGVPVERQTWIELRSATAHLGYQTHLKAVERLEETQRQRKALEDERRAESAASGLRHLTFAAPHMEGPVTGRPSNIPTQAEIDMWDGYLANGADFDAGQDQDDPNVREERLRNEAEVFGLLNAETVAKRLGFGGGSIAEEMLEEEEEEDFLSEIMRNAALEDPEPANLVEGHQKVHQSSEWFPYPSKMMFLLDTLDNLPRLRVSNSLMRVFLWILKEARCKDVPSFDHLRRVQKQIRADCGIPSIPCMSPLGNVFFMNDPRSIIAQDWANPTTRKLIHVYPEIPEDGTIREIWHAEKWRKNMNLDMLSPMFDAGSSHYYVNEVARLKDGKLAIPIRWVLFRGKVFADAFSVSVNEANEASIIDKETVLISADDLCENYLDLEHHGKIPKWSDSTVKAGHPARMPNPKRDIAGGDPLYTSFVDYFGGDVSGNRTKSWNKHWNAYMTHRNLPRKLLQQEFHTHFISTSPNASISEQFREFKSAVESTHTEPVRVRDELGNSTRFCIHMNSGPSYNPMQSEVAGHIGAKGNHPCRKCEVGGTQQEKTTNEGFHALFEAGIPRTKEKIIAELEKQVKLACAGAIKPVKDSQTQTGVKDAYTQHWIDYLLSRFKDIKKAEPNRADTDIQNELIQWTLDNREKIYSAFLTMNGFDPTKDTPVEILHTILLGIVKYIWHVSHKPWSAENKMTYSTRLQSTSTDGLSIPAIRANYIMQYAGSLIGRQLKTIAQTNVFHLHGLVTEDKFMVWRAVGELSALLWLPEIRNLVEYRRDLKVAVGNVLDTFALLDPSKIVTKIKLHLLAHIDEDTVEFGPLVGAATEIFESFNAIFRYCSILSNHLAPSRDIAVQLGDQEGLKHRLTGGWWFCRADEDWTRAGPGVRHFMEAHPVLQRLLGWSEDKFLKHGETKLKPLKRGQKQRSFHLLSTTTAAGALNYATYLPNSEWNCCVSVVSESLDQCFVGSWVFARSSIDEASMITGRISDILINKASTAIVVLELFQVLSVRDEYYGMPVLVRRDGETTFMIGSAKKLKFKFNVQHDCRTAKCEATGERMQMQERVESGNTENFIVHKSLDRFLVNSHAFHNAHLLRAALPRDLLAPIPIFEDRRAKHDEFTSTLRDTRAAKRKTAKKGKGRKRKTAPEPELDDGDEGDPDTAGPSQPRSRKRARTAAPTESREPLDGEGLVASRVKRTVKPSAKALAAAEGSEGSEDEGLDDVSEEEDYLVSDDDYSD